MLTNYHRLFISFQSLRLARICLEDTIGHVPLAVALKLTLIRCLVSSRRGKRLAANYSINVREAILFLVTTETDLFSSGHPI